MLRRGSSILRILHSIVLADVVADVRRPADIDLAGGQEDVDADVDEQAALDLPEHQAGDDVAFLVLGEDRLPFLLPLRLAVGEGDGAVFVLDGFEQHLDRVADLGRRRVGAVVLPLVERDDAFGLVADVDDDIVAEDLEDAAGDDLVGFEVLFVAVDPLVNFLLEDRLPDSGFVVGTSNWRRRLRLTIVWV